ncbi:MAG: ABC transporter ATP-binding protein [Clostridia bacterium]|nr:ABC transporter ATP-binding protein [Clostridia bacterium]MBQ9781545.1 ABC transporter ATP-binding protein [Clostridia bacterium]
MLFGKHINKYYLRYLPAILLGLLALLLVDYMQLVIPEMYRMTVNGINDGVVLHDGVEKAFTMEFLLDEICLPLMVVILVIVFGRFLWRICFRGAAIKMETNLRGEMFDHCKDLSQQYYQVNKVGNLMTLFTNDLETVQDCFGWGVLMFFDAVCLGIMALVKMYRMDPMLTLLSLIPMAFLLIIGAILDHRLEKKWDARQAAFSSLSDFSQESFSGIAVIKAFVKETVELMSFKKLNRDNEDTNVAYTKISTLLNIFVTLFVESVICVVLGYGGYLVWNGTFNAGQLVEFIGYFTSLVWPIMAVSQLIEMRSRGKASLKRIGELLEAKPDVVDGPNVTEPAPLRGDIEFRNLTFRHPGAEYDALTDVSFSIKAGEQVGIIGKTGAGKTTLVDLLLRTYNVPDGTLFVDGYDVNRIPIRTVRQFAAYVPQDNFLFSDTISHNIAFALGEADAETVENAAKLADIHDNITEFKDGYETILGERGVTVSGGQKQRISIARALLKDAGLLILDDSVSAVDVKTEKVILENLRRKRAGKTTILIAHRISTVEAMDKIVFIDDGRVVAVGDHRTLCETCADYRRMVELQKLDDETVSQTPAETEGEEVTVHA